MFSMSTVSLQRLSRLFFAATLLSIFSVALMFTQAYGNVGEEAPEIEVTPGVTSGEVEQGGAVDGSITISNSGKDPLSYTVSAANSQDCSDMSTPDMPWLVIGESRGTIEPGESAQVSFSMIGTLPGEYSGILCVASNDPGRPVVEVPVSLVVTDTGDGEEPGPGPQPGDRWDAIREWLEELARRLRDLLRHLG